MQILAFSDSLEYYDFNILKSEMTDIARFARNSFERVF